ncbi:hypothetical protein NBRC116584_29450 [Hydrogenophaga sp. 5NK40-0174]
MGLFVVFGAYWLVRPMLSSRPWITVSESGLGGHAVSGGLVPWAAIDDVQEGRGRQPHIVVKIKGKRLPKTLRLDVLPAQNRDKAVQAAVAGFVRFGGDHAMRTLVRRHQEEAEVDALREQVNDGAASPWTLYALMALNIGVWLLNVFSGMDAMQPDPADLFAWGANSNWAVLRDGEYWRLVTAATLHGGLIHLGFNMFILWQIGRLMVQWYGNGQFLLIYWGSALAGSALSLHFSAVDGVSVGASGAVFGVVGALLAGIWQHRRQLPSSFVKPMLTSLAMFVLLNLAIGLRPGIDNAAHIGGLVAGAVMGWLLVERVQWRATRGQRKFGWLASVLVVGAVTGGLLATARSEQATNHRELFASINIMREGLPAFLKANEALAADSRAYSAKALSSQAFDQAIQATHIPAMEAVAAQIDQELRRYEGVAPPAAVALKDLASLRAQAMQLEHRMRQQGENRADIRWRLEQTLAEQNRTIALLRELGVLAPKNGAEASAR